MSNKGLYGPAYLIAQTEWGMAMHAWDGRPHPIKRTLCGRRYERLTRWPFEPGEHDSCAVCSRVVRSREKKK